MMAMAPRMRNTCICVLLLFAVCGTCDVVVADALSMIMMTSCVVRGRGGARRAVGSRVGGPPTGPAARRLGARDHRRPRGRRAAVAGGGHRLPDHRPARGAGRAVALA